MILCAPAARQATPLARQREIARTAPLRAMRTHAMAIFAALFCPLVGLSNAKHLL